MLHKTVYLAHLQVHCPSRRPELNKVAGQLRNLFYESSLPWHDGNLGRVISISDFDVFRKKYEELRCTFFEFKPPSQARVALTVIPFPNAIIDKTLLPYSGPAEEFISNALEKRFERRIRMLREALIKEKKFYESLLSELEKVIKMGLYLKRSVDSELLIRMKKAQSNLLCYSAKEIRRSVSLREDIIDICGALL
jgi:hypothetical protein